MYQKAKLQSANETNTGNVLVMGFRLSWELCKNVKQQTEKKTKVFFEGI